MPDFVFETLFFMNYDVCMSPSFESSAMNHSASMFICDCLIILHVHQVVLVRVSGHVFQLDTLG